MNILIIGNGGRESAINWKLSLNPKISKIYSHSDIESLKSIDEYVSFAKEKSIDLTIVGSEELLVKGIVDEFLKAGLKIFGPHKRAAMLEGSKVFAKEFMDKYGVKTAKYGSFKSFEEAKKFLDEGEFPIVVKASGLAAGKGVFILNTKEEALEILKELMIDKKLGDSGEEVVIEEFLEGKEASILSIFDGKKITPFISAKDHKKIGEGETGLNTGGMGVIAPNPFVTEEVLEKFEEDILKPTLNGLIAEKMDFVGVIFFGLMMTKKGVYLLEYNMRMGDPETQTILPLMESDFLEVLETAMAGTLQEIKWKKESSCCVVLVAKGYPGNYEKGHVINGIDKVEGKVFLAGVKEMNGEYLTSGGRVLNVVATGDTLDKARQKAYTDVEKISFDGVYYRKDIGLS